MVASTIGFDEYETEMLSDPAETILEPVTVAEPNEPNDDLALAGRLLAGRRGCRGTRGAFGGAHRGSLFTKQAEPIGPGERLGVCLHVERIHSDQ